MQVARIDDLLRLGAGERIIFEREVPSAAEVSRLVASLANTQGGVIVFGISERGKVHGLRDARKALGTLGQAAQLLLPSLLLDPQIVPHGERELILLEVPQGHDPPYTSADGQVPVRVKARTRPATPEQAVELARRTLQGAAFVPVAGAARDGQRMQAKSASLPPVMVDLDHIMLKLERLIIANAALARKLDDANSWKSRIVDQLIGAVLGLTISGVVFYLFGIG